MKRTRVGPGMVAGIVVVTLSGCIDRPTASVEPPPAPHASVVLGSDLRQDGLVRTELALNRSASVSASASATAGMAAAATFSTVTIGGASEGKNLFPFGGGYFGATRYQQAYAAAQFNSSIPVLIKSVAFVGGVGTLATSTYAFSLSTIAGNIDNLSTANFNLNRGSDNAALATVNLGGAAPATLKIEGAAPFLYDPAKGNLLLDIVVSPGNQIPTGASAAYDSRFTAFGVMSRFHDFGTGFEGYGLITQFELVPLTLDNVLSVVDGAIANGALTGDGQGASAANRLATWLNMLRVAQRSAGTGNDAGPCGLLEQAYLRADGASSPPDFVSGPAAASIARLIQALRSTLGCN